MAGVFGPFMAQQGMGMSRPGGGGFGMAGMQIPQDAMARFPQGGMQAMPSSGFQWQPPQQQQPQQMRPMPSGGFGAPPAGMPQAKFDRQMQRHNARQPGQDTGSVSGLAAGFQQPQPPQAGQFTDRMQRFPQGSPQMQGIQSILKAQPWQQQPQQGGFQIPEGLKGLPQLQGMQASQQSPQMEMMEKLKQMQGMGQITSQLQQGMGMRNPQGPSILRPQPMPQQVPQGGLGGFAQPQQQSMQPQMQQLQGFAQQQPQQPKQPTMNWWDSPRG